MKNPGDFRVKINNPIARNGKGERLLHCPQRLHPAASAADLLTAVPKLW